MGQPMGSYSVTFSVDQNLVALVVLCVFALTGACTAAFGVWIIVAPGRWPARRNLIRTLKAWNATTVNGDPADREALLQRFIQLTGWQLLGMGLGLAVASGVVAWLAIGVTGSLTGIIGSWDSLIIAVLYQGSTLGATLGSLMGTYAVTRIATGLTWADLRRRRVSDYRAAWVGWGPAALAAVTLAPLTAMLLSLTRLQIDIAGGTQTWPAVPTIATMAAWALLIPVIGALLCRWIATSPRAMTASDPQSALAADEMRRAISIGITTSFTWMSCGLTLMAVADIATLNLAPAFGPVSIALLGLLTLLGLLANLFGLGLNNLRGRLGGRITGWRLSLEYILGG